jgi:hypothetical protein
MANSPTSNTIFSASNDRLPPPNQLHVTLLFAQILLKAAKTAVNHHQHQQF